MCDKMDNEVFGDNVFVHCDSHGAAHETGWCTVSVREKTLLTATTLVEAEKECKERGLWLYRD
jgi:hypothetical protein